MNGVKINDKCSITHLLFIDDNKQFSTKSNHLTEVIKTENAFNDIGLLYNGKKSAYLEIKHGKQITSEDIKLDSGQELPCLKEGSHYKYLGLLENITLDDKENWNINLQKYLQRVWLIFSTCASGWNKIRAVNTFANPKLLYLQWILNINKDDLKQADKQTRSIMIKKGALCPGSSIPLIYLDRKNGGRGLKSIEDNYILCKIKIAIYLHNSNSNEIQELLKIEKNRRKKTLLEKAQKYCELLGVTMKQDDNKKWGLVKVNDQEKEIIIKSLREISSLLNEKNSRQIPQ